MSSVHSRQSTQHAPKAPRPLDEDDQYEDAEKNFQPKSLKFWTIIIGMYLSIFLVALVSFAGKGLRQRRPHTHDRDRIE